mmetsp:Transcript_12698/g.29511  ORF Transcript_12698/g.29511 Transcript_12698/m.29511 type:complete len:164 (+) Transcript_12698:357-848(+)
MSCGCQCAYAAGGNDGFLFCGTFVCTGLGIHGQSPGNVDGRIDQRTPCDIPCDTGVGTCPGGYPTPHPPAGHRFATQPRTFLGCCTECRDAKSIDLLAGFGLSRRQRQQRQQRGSWLSKIQGLMDLDQSQSISFLHMTDEFEANGLFLTMELLVRGHDNDFLR